MSIDCGSPGVVRSTTPPAASLVAVSKRVTGSGATSRSRTSIALAVSAEMTARLSARAAREASRGGDDGAALAAASWRTPTPGARRTPGVISTLTSPETPRGPNSDDVPRLSQMTLVWTTAPASMVLNG